MHGYKTAAAAMDCQSLLLAAQPYVIVSLSAGEKTSQINTAGSEK